MAQRIAQLAQWLTIHAILTAFTWGVESKRYQHRAALGLGAPLLAFWRIQLGLLVALGWTLSATVANDLANYICRGTAPTALTTPIKMSLHTADPGATGASEAAGGSYARQTAGYNAASGGACALAATLSFVVQAATYTHIGLWDSTATPKFLQGAALASSIIIGSNGQTIQVTSATNTATGTG